MSESEWPLLTVSQLTDVLKELVETAFARVVVTGEISGLTRAGSGHVYFTLKDESSQIRAVMWKTAASRLRFDLHDGLSVQATGAVEVYGPRGQYQLMVQSLQPQGLGELELAFRQMHAKLAAEGLFDAGRKRPLPTYPRRIALITSPTGAAVRDMLQVLLRRWPGIEVVVLPVAVQGAEASRQIAAALDNVHRIPGVEVVICGRGGGSLEDLWAFNEERTARAIFACQIPVISAVGHEIDVTIADLVADRRALTPTEAAELVIPVRADVVEELETLRLSLTRALRRRIELARTRLDALGSRRPFTRPFDQLLDRSRVLDDLEPRLRRLGPRIIDQARSQLDGLAGALHALSPLAVVDRGYAIIKRLETGELISEAATLQPDDDLAIRLADGRVRATVQEIRLDEEDEAPSDDE